MADTPVSTQGQMTFTACKVLSRLLTMPVWESFYVWEPWPWWRRLLTPWWRPVLVPREDPVWRQGLKRQGETIQIRKPLRFRVHGEMGDGAASSQAEKVGASNHGDPITP